MRALLVYNRSVMLRPKAHGGTHQQQPLLEVVRFLRLVRAPFEHETAGKNKWKSRFAWGKARFSRGLSMHYWLGRGSGRAGVPLF